MEEEEMAGPVRQEPVARSPPSSRNDQLVPSASNQSDGLPNSISPPTSFGRGNQPNQPTNLALDPTMCMCLTIIDKVLAGVLPPAETAREWTDLPLYCRPDLIPNMADHIIKLLARESGAVARAIVDFVWEVCVCEWSRSRGVGEVSPFRKAFISDFVEKAKTLLERNDTDMGRLNGVMTELLCKSSGCRSLVSVQTVYLYAHLLADKALGEEITLDSQSSELLSVLLHALSSIRVANSTMSVFTLILTAGDPANSRVVCLLPEACRQRLVSPSDVASLFSVASLDVLPLVSVSFHPPPATAEALHQCARAGKVQFQFHA